MAYNRANNAQPSPPRQASISSKISVQQLRAVWIIGGRIALVVSSIVGVRLLTEFLAPSEVGRMSLVLSLYQWFGFLFVSPVGLFVLRHANAWSQSGVLRPNLRRMSLYFVICALLSAITVAVLQSLSGLGVAMSPLWIAWLVGGHVLFVVLAGTNTACLNNLGKSFWFVMLGNLAAWAGLGLAALLCLSLGGRTEYWLTGVLIGYVIAWVLSVVALWSISDRRGSAAGGAHEKSHRAATPFALRPLIAFAGPIVPITLIYWFQTDGFRFIVQREVGPATLGLFLIAFTLGGTPILAAERLLVDLLSPDFYRRIASRDVATMKAAWTDYTGLLLPSIVVAVAFVAASGPLLSRVLVSDRFQTIGVYAAYGALFRGIFAATSAMLLWTHAVEKTSSPLPAYVIGSIVAIGGVYLFSARSPMNGTGLALVGAGLCTSGVVAAAIRRRYGITLPWRRMALAAAVSLPLFAVGLPLDYLSSGQGRIVASLMIAPLALYCAVACSLFSGLFGEQRRWRWAVNRLTGGRPGVQNPVEAEAALQPESPL
jgi:O-antigen/teichoic acid export membrane protein